MNSAPAKVTIISIIITALIIFIGSMPEVQASLAYVASSVQSFSNALDPNLTPVDKLNKPAENTEQVTVNRVVDGDTIVLEDGRTVRLLNVDTPETKKPGTPVMCYGPEASSFTTKMLDKRSIIIKPDKEDKDRFGRILRFIFFVGEDTSAIANSFNAKLINEGYAKSSTVKPNNTYQSYLEGLERQAKQSNVGIWDKCSNPFKE